MVFFIGFGFVFPELFLSLHEKSFHLCSRSVLSGDKKRRKSRKEGGGEEIRSRVADKKGRKIFCYFLFHLFWRDLTSGDEIKSSFRNVPLGVVPKYSQLLICS